MYHLTHYPDAATAASAIQQTGVPVYTFNGLTAVEKSNQTVPMRATILEKVFGLDNFLLLQAIKDETFDFDPVAWRSKLEYVLGGGIMHEGGRFKIVGASSSLKDGRFWLASEQLIRKLHLYFRSAQEALAYFGIFTSGCHHGIWNLNYPIEYVKDGIKATGDGFGYIPVRLLDELAIPHRQIQVRFVGSNWLGKGTLHPYDGNTILMPESMVKGAGKPNGMPYWFGIRDVAAVRGYASNFTVAQWFSTTTHDKLRSLVDDKLETIKQAFHSSESALTFLGLVARWSEESTEWIDPQVRTNLEAFIKAGLSPKHRYVHNHLKKLVRKAYVTLASGGGIELKGRMMAFAGLPDAVVCIPDLPEGKVVVSRYPIRDKASFLVLINKPNAINHAIRGSIYLNEAVAKQIDGDFDGDYAIVCTQKPVIDEILSPQWLKDFEREDAPVKNRRNDPIHLLPYVAASSLGNGIGFITYMIASCLASNRPELIAPLSAQLQSEVQKLKWDSSADWEFIRRTQKEIAIPAYLNAFKADKALFIKKADLLEDRNVVADNYNHVARDWQRIDSIPDPLIHFRYLIPLWSSENAPDYLPECKAVVSYYNEWITGILRSTDEPTEDDIRPAIDFLRSWAAMKSENREAWSVAMWNAVHDTRSEKSSGSAAFHAFPAETFELIRKFSNGDLVIVPASPNTGVLDDDVTFTMNGRTYHRIIKEQNGSLPLNNPYLGNGTVLLPVVGGWYCMPGQSSQEKMQAFEQQLGKLAANGQLSVETVALDGQLLFYHSGFCLGQLPKDNMYRESLRADQHFPARYTIKGRTVYLVVACQN